MREYARPHRSRAALASFRCRTIRTPKAALRSRWGAGGASGARARPSADAVVLEREVVSIGPRKAPAPRAAELLPHFPERLVFGRAHQINTVLEHMQVGGEVDEVQRARNTRPDRGVGVGVGLRAVHLVNRHL